MKFVATILLTTVLLAESLLPKGVGLSQDFKLGELVYHFSEHKQQKDKEFSIFDFLWLHYAAESQHRQQQHHDNLPCLDGHQLTFALAMPVAQPIAVASADKYAISKQSLPNFYRNSYKFSPLVDVLNPPQCKLA